MDSPTDRTVALMAIQPRFADLILRGAKRVEFRKTLFRRPVSHVVIYACSPVAMVVGAFEVEGLDIGHPGDLWERYSSVAGIPAADYSDYYSGRELGVALRIGRVLRLAHSMPLSAVCGTSNPPQSFQYVRPSALDIVRSWSSG